jgi:hypothetical protein
MTKVPRGGRPVRLDTPKGRESVEITAGPSIRLGANLRVQIAVCAILLVPVVLVFAFSRRHSLSEAWLACVVPVLLTGTFRTAAIRGDRFVTHFHVGFFPVVTERCNLRAVTSVNARFGWDGPGIGTVLLFGPTQFLFGWLFEFLIPALGGPYQIHLITAKGRELVAWRGFVDSHFHKTLDLLAGLTNAEVLSM